MQSDKVLNLPAGYFGIVLGTIGMGFAWRYASQVWQVSHWLGDGLVILAMIIWGLLTGAFITRLIRFPHSVLAEVRHPVLSSFVSLFPATTMLVAIGFVPWFRPLAVCLFSFGVVVQLAYAAWQTAGLWRGSHPEEATTPGLYLPTVANNFISAMACGALGYTDAGLVEVSNQPLRGFQLIIMQNGVKRDENFCTITMGKRHQLGNIFQAITGIMTGTKTRAADINSIGTVQNSFAGNGGIACRA